MIDFEQPFVLGVFWALFFISAGGAGLWAASATRRRLAAYDRTLEHVERASALCAQKITALEERARLRDQLAVQALASSEERGADFRFRTQGTASVVMALENWLRVVMAQLEDHNIPVVAPAPWFGRRRGEHDTYPVIEQAREERLQGKINEYKQSLGGLDWEKPV